MKFIHLFGLVSIAGSLALVGCQQSTPSRDSTNQQGQTGSGAMLGAAVSAADIKAALAKLSPEDRALAEAQKKCPVSGEPLGSMGTPPKVMVKGEPVFLCCSSCNAKALAHPDRTLDKVKEFKAEKAASSGE
jgi:hypothetical protein